MHTWWEMGITCIVVVKMHTKKTNPGQIKNSNDLHQININYSITNMNIIDVLFKLSMCKYIHCYPARMHSYYQNCLLRYLLNILFVLKQMYHCTSSASVWTLLIINVSWTPVAGCLNSQSVKNVTTNSHDNKRFCYFNLF